MGQPFFNKACATPPARLDPLETENPGEEWRVGPAACSLASVCWLSQEILWPQGPGLSLASELGAEEGQGQGPGGRMYRNSVPCKGKAALAALAEEMGLPVIHRQFCRGQVKQRRLAHITHLTEAKCGHPDFRADAPCPTSLINV